MREKKMLPVLDHGYLHLQEWMGGDRAVIEAARHCYQSVPKDSRADRKLIRHLMESGHTSVFEHAVMRWEVKAPLFVARQWMRHRHASISERSLRYTIADREYYVPGGAECPEVVEAIKRRWRDGSPEVIPVEDMLSFAPYIYAMEDQFDVYDYLIRDGMKCEQARGVLGTAVYTSWYWTVNATAFMHWLDLRLDQHAQWEHQQYAEAALEAWGAVMPIMCQAYLRARAKEEA